MSIFRNKILIKIIVTLCIALTIINSVPTNTVYAAEWGGILITPITKLLTSIADGIMSIMHQAALDQEVTIVEISGNATGWDSWGKQLMMGVIFVVAVVVVSAAIIASAGGLAPFAAGGFAAFMAGAKVVTLSGVAVLAAVGINKVTVEMYNGKGAVELAAETLGDWWFNDESLYMPAFSLTPEEIFSNQIRLLDVNFFNSMEDKVTTTNKYVVTGTTTEEKVKNFDWNVLSEFLYPWKPEEDDPRKGNKISNGYYVYQGYLGIDSRADWIEWNGDDWDVEDELYETGMFKYTELSKKVDYNTALENAYSAWISDDTLKEQAKNLFEEWGFPEENISNDYKYKYIPTSWDSSHVIYACTTEVEYYYYPHLTTKIQILDSNDKVVAEYEEELISRNNMTEDKYEYIKNVKVIKPEFNIETTNVVEKSTASQLKETISKWYFTLRNLALLVLMLVLIYIGIRIVIGSTAGEKAKYKERLQDWLIAMCLLFIMHYIMAFAIEVVERITALVATVGDGKGIVEYVPLKENHVEQLKEEDEAPEKTMEYQTFEVFGTITANEAGEPYLAWITNIMGRMRIMSQTTAEGTARWVGYSLCYIVLVIETLFFLWTYLKRVLYMAFLTIIAPLVAMTYPIDKITDGKAQAFDAWLKEYIFNLLIQPLHLLLYTILISAAYDLAMFNPLYAIVAVGFMMPAENLMRKFFGFTKAQTPGALGGAAGAALAFTGLQKVMNLGKHKGGGSSKGDKGGKDNSKIRFSKSGGPDPKKTVANKVQGKESGTSKIKTATPAPKAGESAENTTINMAKGNKTVSEAKKVQQQSDKKRKAHVVKAAAGRYKRMIGQKMANRINKMRPIRAMARGAAGLAGAATFGMAGLALGIASGDASKAFQYTTAGAAGGYSAGKGLAGSAVDALSVDTKKMKDEMEMTYYGEDYKQFKFDESVDNMSEDEGNIDTIRQLTGLSYEESQDMLQTVGRSCYESGITNMEDIAAVYEMESQGYSRDEAIAALKFNQYLPSDLNKMGEDDRDDHINRWAREYEEAGYDNSLTLAQESMKLAEKINKIKSGLKKA